MYNGILLANVDEPEVKSILELALNISQKMLNTSKELLKKNKYK